MGPTGSIFDGCRCKQRAGRLLWDCTVVEWPPGDWTIDGRTRSHAC